LESSVAAAIKAQWKAKRQDVAINLIGTLLREGRKRQVGVNDRIKSPSSFSALFAKYAKEVSPDFCALK
jgi:hypothetical protein